MLTLEQAKQRAFDRCNLQSCPGGDIDIYKELYRYKALRDLPEEEFDQLYEDMAFRLGLCR